MKDRAERAIFDLRRGQPLRLLDPGQDLLVASVEALHRYDADALAALAGSPARLVVSGPRAVALGLADDDSRAWTLPLNPEEHDLVRALAGLVDPELTLPAGPPRPASAAEAAAVDLARAGRLLPAVLVFDLGHRLTPALGQQLAEGSVLELPVAAVAAATSPGAIELRCISQADVPLALAGHARFVLFREGNGLDEHVAILVGRRADWPEQVPVRLHSSCLTGDIFGSLRCDCGEQLRGSVARIGEMGGGVLLYLAQEGRGIGLANKLRAYTRQDAGLDTVAANHALGFPDDQRDFTIAAAMLRQLDIHRIVLLTNNPRKLDALARAGVEVAGQLSIFGTLNPFNERYMATKAERSGHLLDDLLSRGE
ncbi:MAG: GTP cyclohydrolase II [Lysobacteraceae bacterium]